MDFSVLTPEFRQQLEEQLDRLNSERDAIVQAAVAQATRTIDANLSHMNALLGKTTDRPDGRSLAIEGERPIANQSSTKTKTKPPLALASEPEEHEPEDIEEKNQKVSKRKLKEKSSSSPSSVFNALKVSKASKKGAVKAPFEGPQLTPDFQGLELADAIPAVFRQEPDRHFFIDDVITALYGTVESSILPKTRQRVAVSLGHSARRQEVRKVQDFPSIYCLNTEEEE